MNQVRKVWNISKKKNFQKNILLDNLNIENVIMGVVRKILANMPLETPQSNELANLSAGPVARNESACSC